MAATVVTTALLLRGLARRQVGLRRVMKIVSVCRIVISPRN
jgi:hypothetical protein